MSDFQANLGKLFQELIHGVDYRTRMADRNPEFNEYLSNWAKRILHNSATMSQEEHVEFTRNEQPLLVPAIEGMLNALEHFSKGAIASRPTGPGPINTVGAFSHWLMENPDIEERFRQSDIFQELCDSGKPGFEWPEDNVKSAHPERDIHPGNYL